MYEKEVFPLNVISCNRKNFQIENWTFLEIIILIPCKNYYKPSQMITCKIYNRKVHLNDKNKNVGDIGSKQDTWKYGGYIWCYLRNKFAITFNVSIIQRDEKICKDKTTFLVNMESYCVSTGNKQRLLVHGFKTAIKPKDKQDSSFLDVLNLKCYWQRIRCLDSPC